MCYPIPVFVDMTVSQPFHSAAIMPPRSMSDGQERLITYVHAE